MTKSANPDRWRIAPLAVSCPLCRSTLDLTSPGGWCDTCARPVLLGYAEAGQIVVWCPHCEREHHHGAVTTQTADARQPSGTGCRIPALSVLVTATGLLTATATRSRTPARVTSWPRCLI